MRDTHIKNIREACIKANSDIVKLKFGCEFITLGDDRKLKYICKFSDEKYCVAGWIYRGFGECLKTSVGKIIGRPITLADVLLAWIVKHNKDGDSMWGSASWIQIIKEWNLRKNHLEDQSEECKKFLSEILTNK